MSSAALPIDFTKITRCLGRAFGQKQIQNARITDIKRIDPGTGFVSIILRVRIDWGSQSNVYPNSVVVKFVTASKLLEERKKLNLEVSEALIRETTRFTVHCHMVECTVYKILNRAPRGVQIPRIPKVYLADSTGFRDPDGSPVLDDCLIMEDLTETASMGKPGESMTHHQVTQVLEDLAVLHAFSLKTRDWYTAVDLGPFPYNWGPFAIELQIGAKEGREVFSDVFDFSDNEINTLTNIDRIRASWMMNDGPTDLVPVLVHGDLWRNNIMFSKGGDVAAIIDWQLAGKGSPAADMARILITSVSEDFRRHEFPKLLRSVYFRKLESLLGRPVPYSYDAFMREYEKFFVGQAGFFVGMAKRVQTMNENREIKGDTRPAVNRIVSAGRDALHILGRRRDI